MSVQQQQWQVGEAQFEIGDKVLTHNTYDTAVTGIVKWTGTHNERRVVGIETENPVRPSSFSGFMTDMDHLFEKSDDRHGRLFLPASYYEKVAPTQRRTQSEVAVGAAQGLPRGGKENLRQTKPLLEAMPEENQPAAAVMLPRLEPTKSGDNITYYNTMPLLMASPDDADQDTPHSYASIPGENGCKDPLNMEKSYVFDCIPGVPKESDYIEFPSSRRPLPDDHMYDDTRPQYPIPDSVEEEEYISIHTLPDLKKQPVDDDGTDGYLSLADTLEPVHDDGTDGYLALADTLEPVDDDGTDGYLALADTLEPVDDDGTDGYLALADTLEPVDDDGTDGYFALADTLEPAETNPELTYKAPEPFKLDLSILKGQLKDHDKTISEQQQIITQQGLDISELKDNVLLLQDQITIAQQQIFGMTEMVASSRHWVVSPSEIVIQEEIGKGGWGHVNLAIFRGKKVAAKQLHSLIVSPKIEELFQREMEMAIYCQHKNIVTFLGATLQKANPIILMELMDTNLRSAYADESTGTVSAIQMHEILRVVAVALHFLHTRSEAVIHRDVSSANVLLKKDHGKWVTKLGDLGSARMAHLATTPGPGSITYAAPEAFDPKNHSPKMDVYSFGILVIECVTRKLPFQIVAELKVQVQGTYPQYLPIIDSCTKEASYDRPTMNGVIKLWSTSV